MPCAVQYQIRLSEEKHQLEEHLEAALAEKHRLAKESQDNAQAANDAIDAVETAMKANAVRFQEQLAASLASQQAEFTAEKQSLLEQVVREGAAARVAEENVRTSERLLIEAKASRR